MTALHPFNSFAACCPKCGSQRPYHTVWYERDMRCCAAHAVPEHLYRRCVACSFSWKERVWDGRMEEEETVTRHSGSDHHWYDIHYRRSRHTPQEDGCQVTTPGALECSECGGGHLTENCRGTASAET